VGYTFTKWSVLQHSRYTKVLRNKVQSSIEIIRNYVISNEVIGHKKKLGRSVLKENE